MAARGVDLYRFRTVVEQDLALLRRWLGTPEVARWWGAPDEEVRQMRAGLADPAVAMWLVEHQGRPFAYIQDYDLEASWPDHPWIAVPRATRGIDQLIGEPDMLGRGHGPAFIRLFTDRLFSAGTPCVVTDPHPDNLRARRAYEKVGFCGEEVHGRECGWGPALLMTRFAPAQAVAAPACGP